MSERIEDLKKAMEDSFCTHTEQNLNTLLVYPSYSKRSVDALILALEERVRSLVHELAECYRAAGAEPADHDPETAALWDSKHALRAVQELRKDGEDDYAALESKLAAVEADLMRSKETNLELANVDPSFYAAVRIKALEEQLAAVEAVSEKRREAIEVLLADGLYKADCQCIACTPLRAQLRAALSPATGERV